MNNKTYLNGIHLTKRILFQIEFRKVKFNESILWLLNEVFACNRLSFSIIYLWGFKLCASTCEETSAANNSFNYRIVKLK